MNTKCIVKKRHYLKGKRLNPGDIIEVPYGAVGLLLRQGKVSIYNDKSTPPAPSKNKSSGTTKKK